MWVVGCGVWGVGCGVWGVGCGVWGAGCGVWGVGFDVERQGLGISDKGSPEGHASDCGLGCGLYALPEEQSMVRFLLFFLKSKVWV